MPYLTAEVEVISRQGINGIGSRINAYKPVEVTKYTLEGATLLITAQTAIDYYSALKGCLVAVTEDCGRIITYALVIDVKVNNVRRVLTPSYYLINYLIEATWLLCPTAF